MRVATFKSITGEYKISDIVVTDPTGRGGHSVQKVKADGTWGDMYYYLTMEGSFYAEDGWYKEDQWTPVTDEDVIGKGEALFVNAASAIDLTYSGQVHVGKPDVTLPAGKSMIGNPTPKQIKISDLGVFDSTGRGGHSVQKVKADGTWGDMYYYLTMEGSFYAEDGWYKEDQWTPVTDEDLLNEGEGLFLNASSEIKITFPMAL